MDQMSFERNPSPSPSLASSEDRGLTIRQKLALLAFGALSFLFFFAWKLPEARIQNLATAHLKILAQERGYYFSAEKIRVGLLLGPCLKLYNVQLRSIEDEKRSLKIPYVRVSPSLFSFLSKNKGVSISAELLGGSLSGFVGGSPTSTSIDLKLKKLNPAPLRQLTDSIPVEVQTDLSGYVILDLDFDNIGKSSGAIDLKASRVALPPQTLYGIAAPKIMISEIKTEATLSHGQMLVRTFDIGTDARKDDLYGKISGDVNLNARLNSSKLNLKMVLEISRPVFDAFPPLEGLLTYLKTPDGKYAVKITGSIGSPEMNPAG